MAVSVRVDLHQAELARFKYSPSGPIFRKVFLWSAEVRAVATVLAPKQTGQLAGSNHVQMNTHAGFVVGEVSFTARHALWVHEGTGIYGSRRRPIRAHGKAMKFPGRVPGRRGGFIYARTVSGQRGKPFLVMALRLVMVPKGARIRTVARR
jgi:hypothetical protein